MGAVDEARSLLASKGRADDILTAGPAIDLSGRKLTDADTPGTVRLIERNESRTQLDLRGNALGNAGASCIGGALVGISEHLQREEAARQEAERQERERQLGTWLAKPGWGQGMRTAATIDRSGIWLADADMVGFALLLAANASLTFIDVHSNNITDAGAIALGKALAVNASLTVLDLGQNRLTDAAALALADMLKVNACLRELWLGGNQIGEKGAVGLAEGLRVNASLAVLGLERNQIADAGAIDLAKALEANVSLTWLNLSRNQFGEACKTAIQAAWLSKPGRKQSGLHIYV